MGGASLSAGANWPERMWGSQQQSGLVLGDAGPPQMDFAGNIPYNAARPSRGRPSGTRRTTAGSSPPTWRGSGAGAPSRWASSTGTTSSRTRAGPWAAPPATSTSTGSSTGGYDAAGNNLSQTGDPFASFLLGQVHAANQSIYAQPTWYESYLSPWINAEFKVNPQAHADRGTAPGLPDRPHRGERRVLDVRSEHAQPGRGRPARGRDLRGRAVRAVRDRGRSRTRSGTRGDRGPGSPIASTTRPRSAAGTGCTTPGWPSPSSPATRTSGSPRTRSAPNLTNGLFPRFLPRRRVPAAGSSAAAVHRPHHRQRRRRARGVAGRVDAAALPELVPDVRAPADQEHDARRLLHREPREPSESPCAARGPRLQHERSRASWRWARRS